MNNKDLLIAITAVKRVIFNDAFSDKVLSSVEEKIESHSFVRFALYGTLREYYFIENFLFPKFLSKSKVKKYDKLLVAAIYTGLFLINSSNQKDHTVVNMLVEIIKKEVNDAASKVLNGVLRNSLREGLYKKDIKILTENSEFYKKIKRDHPQMFESIIDNLLNSDIKAGGYFCNETKVNNYDVSCYSNEYFYVKPAEIGSVAKDFIFQDLANHLLMKSFVPFIDDNQLSVESSSYPGGKSFYINRGFSIHCDIIPWKVKALKERISEIKENSNKKSFLTADATKLPFKDCSIDNMFLDVPCSGSGIITKKPEIAINFTELNMKSTIEIQRDILDEAARVTKVGGRIFYSTCSIFLSENETQIKKFLSKHKNFILDKEYAPPINFNGYYSSIENLDEMDGIFGTILLKKE